MKRMGLLGTFSIFMVVSLSAVLSVEAQQGGRGGFRTRAAYILSDYLLLNDASTEKLVAAYEDVSGQIFEDMRNSNVDWRNMSPEERNKRFSEMQKKTAEGLKTKLKDAMPEAELAAIGELLGQRMFMPDPEIRGLRLSGLNDGQRKTLQPLSIAAGKLFVPMPSPFTPEDPNREEKMKKFETAKAALVAKAGETLTDEQKQTWEEKTKETKAENDEMLERMRQFRPQQ